MLSGKAVGELSGPQHREISQRSRAKKAHKARARAPEFVSPMKATLVGQFPCGDEWLYEDQVGWLPCISRKARYSVGLLSLKNKNLSSDFPAIVEAVRGVTAEVVLSMGRSLPLINAAALPFRCCRIAPRSDGIGRLSITPLTFWSSKARI